MPTAHRPPEAIAFSEATRRIAPEALFDEVIAAYQVAFARLVPSLRRSDYSPIGMKYALPFRTSALLQCALRRTLELASGMETAIEAGQYIAAAVLSRSALEPGCLALDTALRIEGLLEKPTAETLDAFGEHLHTLQYGVRAREWTESLAASSGSAVPKAISALTLVQRVQKRIPGTETLYDAMCELAHPNNAGLLDAYSDLDGTTDDAEMHFVFEGREERVRAGFLRNTIEAAGIALTMVDDGLGRLDACRERFTRATEERRYREDNWPKDFEYRWGG